MDLLCLGTDFAMQIVLLLGLALYDWHSISALVASLNKNGFQKPPTPQAVQTETYPTKQD